jgi:hypothetical protein
MLGRRATAAAFASSLVREPVSTGSNLAMIFRRNMQELNNILLIRYALAVPNIPCKFSSNVELLNQNVEPNASTLAGNHDAWANANRKFLG